MEPAQRPRSALPQAVLERRDAVKRARDAVAGCIDTAREEHASAVKADDGRKSNHLGGVMFALYDILDNLDSELAGLEGTGCGMGGLSAHDAGRCGPGCDLEAI